jgi:recombinational DNA repair protein RecT
MLYNNGLRKQLKRNIFFFNGMTNAAYCARAEIELFHKFFKDFTHAPWVKEWGNFKKATLGRNFSHY